jgi:hypothetical protein
MRSADRQAQQVQPGGIVARLQADIGKDDAIAAKPAGGAKLSGEYIARILRAVQSTLKLRPNTLWGNCCIFGLPAGQFSCKVMAHYLKGQLYERTT